MTCSMSWSSSGSLDSNSSSECFSDSSDRGWGSNVDGRISHGQVWEKADNIKQWREEDMTKEAGWLSSQLDARVFEKIKKPDLLDSLIMEEKVEQMRRNDINVAKPSIIQDNLIKLLKLQQSSSSPVGRPITGNNTSYTTLISHYQNNMVQEQVMFPNVTLRFPGQFPPVNFKIPPPHHPPAVPGGYQVTQTSRTYPTTLSRYTSLPASSTTFPIQPPSYQPIVGSTADLQLRVGEVQWQVKALEKERKKTEVALAKLNPGMKISPNNSVQVPRLPPSQTKLDKLVVDIMREQTRVVSIVDRVMNIKGKSLSPELSSCLTRWKESVMNVMAMSRRKRIGQVQRDNWEIVAALAQLSLYLRKARTVLWTVSVEGQGN